MLYFHMIYMHPRLISIEHSFSIGDPRTRQSNYSLQAHEFKALEQVVQMNKNIFDKAHKKSLININTMRLFLVLRCFLYQLCIIWPWAKTADLEMICLNLIDFVCKFCFAHNLLLWRFKFIHPDLERPCSQPGHSQLSLVSI